MNTLGRKWVNLSKLHISLSHKNWLILCLKTVTTEKFYGKSFTEVPASPCLLRNISGSVLLYWPDSLVNKILTWLHLLFLQNRIYRWLILSQSSLCTASTRLGSSIHTWVLDAYNQSIEYLVSVNHWVKQQKRDIHSRNIDGVHCSVETKHFSTRSTRFGFSKAAATLSLSFNCLLTAPRKQSLNAKRH